MLRISKIALLCAASAATVGACGASSDGDDAPGASGGAGASNSGAPGSAGAAGALVAGLGASASSMAGAVSVAGAGGVGGFAGAGGAPSLAGAGGASAGAAGNASAGTSGMAGSGGAGCAVAPVNPKATQQAKKLLCYLYSQSGNHVLSGQQETSWSNPESDITWYTDNGMKAPAILGGDYLYPTGTTARAIAYWNAGGIPMIRYHMGAPPNSDTYENSMGSANLDQVLVAGSAENSSFKAKLDYAAGELSKLQQANVAVLWAPFHEVQQNGWFWWSKGSGAQFVAIWKYTFDYLTTQKGLNNLVWLMPFSGSPNAAYYPGKAYLDLSGPDTYATNQPFSAMYGTAKSVVGGELPIPLHETGLIPTPSQMFPSAAPWVLFNVWATYQRDGTHNTLGNIKAVYADSHTVTRDEVPSLK